MAKEKAETKKSGSAVYNFLASDKKVDASLSREELADLDAELDDEDRKQPHWLQSAVVTELRKRVTAA